MATPSPARPLHSSGGLSIVIAILLILAGLAAIALPLIAGIAVSIAVAWLLLIAGVIHLFFGWHTRSAGAVIWKILVGLAYLVAAFYIFDHPGRGLLTLTLVLAFYLFFEGIFEAIIYAQLRRFPGSGWFLFDAIVTIVLGIMILMSWPVSSVWAVGTLIGISILFSGITRLSYAFAARRAIVAPAS
ncbi:MAG TPA: DUF308 domain-containing protein [Acidobacteriaceae bacterium]|jgi:uncharacterized membrane protein HdeD (DUF308 family)